MSIKSCLGVAKANENVLKTKRFFGFPRSQSSLWHSLQGVHFWPYFKSTTEHSLFKYVKILSQAALKLVEHKINVKKMSETSSIWIRSVKAVLTLHIVFFKPYCLPLTILSWKLKPHRLSLPAWTILHEPMCQIWASRHDRNLIASVWTWNLAVKRAFDQSDSDSCSNTSAWLKLVCTILTTKTQLFKL